MAGIIIIIIIVAFLSYGKLWGGCGKLSDPGDIKWCRMMADAGYSQSEMADSLLKTRDRLKERGVGPCTLTACR